MAETTYNRVRNQLKLVVKKTQAALEMESGVTDPDLLTFGLFYDGDYLTYAGEPLIYVP